MTLAKQVAALKAELAALKQKQTEEPKPWPQVGDEIFYIDEYGVIKSGIVETPRDLFIAALLARGNIFRTKEHAKREAEAQKVIAELRAQPGRRAFETGTTSHGIHYDARNGVTVPTSCWQWDSNWQQINFDTAEHRDAAIAKVGEDLILAAMVWMGEKP